MNSKINFNRKKIFKYSYFAIIGLNILALLFLFTFTKKYMIETIEIDGSALISNKEISIEKININKFDLIYQKIKAKTNFKKINNIKNIFD